MKGNKGQMGRWMDIIEILNNSKYPVKGKTLSIMVSVCEKTITRDIKHLNEEHENPIKQDSATHGYYLDEPTFTLNSGFITESKLEDLVMAEILLNMLGLGDVSRKVGHLVDEIGADRKEVINSKRAALSRHIVQDAGSELMRAHTAILVRAFTRGQQVRLQIACGEGSCWRSLSSGRLVVRNGALHVTGKWHDAVGATQEVALSQIFRVQVYKIPPAEEMSLAA